MFVQLHRDGLIYKAKRLVNWDPKFQTAISDLEVVQVDCKGSFKWSRDDGAPLDEAALAKALGRNPNGHLYYFDYPVVDANGEETGEVVTVATTRPETMLGDSAVAVHPDDERFKRLVGANVRLPLVGRLMRIVADAYSDPEKGTGAVKITPAHDFNDFDVGRRHEAEGARQINILDAEARICAERQSRLLRRPRRRRSRADPPARRGRRRRPIRSAQAHRRHDGGGRASGEDRAARPHRSARRPLQRGHRAVADRPMVRRRQDAGRAGARRGARGQDPVRAEELGEDLFRLAGEHPAVVRLAPALVGPPDSGLVRALGRGLCRGERGGGFRRRACRRRRARRAERVRGRGFDRRSAASAHDLPARSRRARHLVLLGPVAVLDARLAGRDARARPLLSDQRAGHRLRHHLLLGRPDDDDGPALPRRGPVPRRLHPRPRPRREGREDVEVEGQRHRPARPDRPLRRRRAALHAVGDGGAGARHQAVGEPRRGLSQLRHQAVERLALRRDERLRARRRLRSEGGARAAQPLDSRRGRQGRRGNQRGDRSPTASTTPPTPPTASSGACSATGASSSPSRCCRAPSHRRPRPRPRRRSPMSSTRSTPCCIRSCPSSPRSCGRSKARRARRATACSRSGRGRAPTFPSTRPPRRRSAGLSTSFPKSARCARKWACRPPPSRR